ncbi:response regulator transcription factor [Flavobacteriaceae bacterium]|nr:response regulator transcription factor [Flavobacteriaceae bacterium]MDB4066909.1 response regulator transcription factor [Flavobacteriaceae bacterium]MDO7702717.1 response regulator transcription factor [Flavobacteriaceae bacterium]|tara:strand:+ start:98 stop:790 length:693 start_codon:yes stop_codon:yes gene_type:complete
MEKSSIKILLVDDEPDIIEILTYNLSKEGYQVFSAANGKEALVQAGKIIPHLIILDIMMPVMDGIEACENIRKDSRFEDTIIMFLSARSEDYSHLAAFDVGADDYVNKPIKPKVLNSKVSALLRRFTKNETNSEIIQGDLTINIDEYKVVLKGEKMSFPRKEFELLRLLASQPDKVFKREKIMEAVWGNDVVVGDRTIDVHIRKLREKMGNAYFKTIKGVGYKFVINENN